MKDLPLARYASPLQLEPLRIRSARAVGNSAGNFRNSVAVNRFPDLVEMGSLVDRNGCRVGSVSEYEPWLRTASTGR